jgi:NitT/TauT family transport system substrate-binding protein
MNRRTSLFTCAALVATAASGQAATDLGTANLSWQPGPDTPQVAQAVAQGLWTKRGVTVKSTATATGREAMEALLGGAADYALMAELPPVIAAMQHQNFRVLAAISQYHGMRVIATTAVDLSSLKNLAGKKIGTTLGTNVDFQGYETLVAAGVNPTMLNVAPPDMVPALARGDIDAAFMFPQAYPLAKNVLGNRYAEILGDVRSRRDDGRDREAPGSRPGHAAGPARRRDARREGSGRRGRRRFERHGRHDAGAGDRGPLERLHVRRHAGSGAGQPLRA